MLQDEPAYFRIFHVFGSIWACWWNCFTDRYRRVSDADVERFGLGPLTDIVRQIAALTRMNFFSSEIALTEENEFVVIDYVNDQCHLLTQSANPRMGVPDDLVAAIALRLVEASQELMQTAKAP